MIYWISTSSFQVQKPSNFWKIPAKSQLWFLPFETTWGQIKNCIHRSLNNNEPNEYICLLKCNQIENFVHLRFVEFSAEFSQRSDISNYSEMGV